MSSFHWLQGSEWLHFYLERALTRTFSGLYFYLFFGVGIFWNSTRRLLLSSEIILNINYLQESISFELQVGSKICKFPSLYRSPNQTSDDFEKFTDYFEITLAESNSDLVVALGDLVHYWIGTIMIRIGTLMIKQPQKVQISNLLQYGLHMS